MNKKRVIIFTTTRAEYGLLRWVIRGLESSRDFVPVVCAGGTHLQKEHGYTLKEITGDGISNIVKLPFLGTSCDSAALTSAVGKGLWRIAPLFKRYKPDFLIILGDRYELYIAAISALLFNVPIVHLHGGEISEGAADQQVRHSITKLAHIHMPATPLFAENISKMGEEDWRIHVVGAPGLENIRRMDLYQQEDILKRTGIDMSIPTVLCTYHPVTLENEASQQINNLLRALSLFDVQVVFTAPNADTDSNIILRAIKNYVHSNRNSYFIPSLGSQLYLSMLKHAKAVIGNSSSGIIEVPSFNIPTVNIGNRQEGRLKPPSVIQTGYRTTEIEKGLKRALCDNRFLRSLKNLVNPYGDGKSSAYIVEALREVTKLPQSRLLKKKLAFPVKKNEWHTYY